MKPEGMHEYYLIKVLKGASRNYAWQVLPQACFQAFSRRHPKLAARAIAAYEVPREAYIERPGHDPA